MKRHQPTILTALALLAALTTFTALAQPPGRGPGHGPFGPLGGRLAEFLDLTEEQQAGARQLAEQAHDAIQPLLEEQHSLRQEIGEVLESEDPAPARVGELVLEARALREQLEQARQSFEEDFTALLTAEQRDRFALLQEARQIFGPRGHHRGPGRRGPGRGGEGLGFGGPGDGEPPF